MDNRDLLIVHVMNCVSTISWDRFLERDQMVSGVDRTETYILNYEESPFLYSYTLFGGVFPR